ncbi:hypothetical protein KIN_36450 [Litoreibacter roseus]|uniref:Uncharacterized protein n=1 Tax=Litoreibacter roseus TaxID=2601869 RepID=A0A6N6JJR1_9RHOB|nr:hypothetical protein KIN_36450 [Litoreibacter roseus]
MDMRIVGVPVIDGDPIEFGAEIALGLGHEVARESAQILHLSGVFRRDDEAEMMTVVFGARGEGAVVGLVVLLVEHGRIPAVLGDALALQIVEMLGERC